MRRFSAFAIATIVALSAVAAHAQTQLPAMLKVLGSVTIPAGPAENALVIALNLEDFAAVQTYTGTDGSFSLPKLRNGIYRVIALKQGFIPATATVVPTRSHHKVTLRMADEKSARARSRAQEIWEIRGSLPPDVLREVDRVLAGEADLPYEVPRFRGEMVSMTGVANAAPSYAQTALGLQSRLTDNWQLGISGNMQRVANPIDSSANLTSPVAESSVMSMEIRSGANESYRVASTKSWWRYRDTLDAGERQADVQAHNFEWEHGESRLQIRYLAQANLYRPSAFDSDVIEIGGDTSIMQTGRSALGVSVRVVQESFRGATNTGTPAEVVRKADLGANGTVLVGRGLLLQYGLASRIGLDSSAWAPRTGAEWKFNKSSAIFVTGMYKVLDESVATTTPIMTTWSDEARILPKYSYSLGVASTRNEANQVSAVVSVSKVDAPLRVVFADAFDQFWDGLYVDSGDTRRDVRLNGRKTFGKALAVDVTTSAGEAEPTLAASGRKSYVSGDLQSTFLPTRTSLALSYRGMRQPHPVTSADYSSKRVNVRLAQSLYLPVDLKVLLGLELSNAANSPFLADDPGQDDAKRYIGGLALKF